MTDYNFQSLNDKEFEALCTDLLSEHLGVRIERFKPGKDKGVDGRWFSAGKKENVLQCKHWSASGFASLLRHLKTSELPKIDRLQCSRYVLATSVSLSRKNKEDVASGLAPHVLSHDDVFGLEDLSDLLERYPGVVQRHYKLWLTSSTTLSLLLNSAIIGRSQAELDQIRQEAAIYVRTNDHHRAWEHLSTRRVALLTGEPGIGKTTLARQLALEHVAQGWEFFALEDNVSEAESVFTSERNQLFYFDDFLGRTFLEAFRAKQDSHVVTFLKRVARDPRKRFILTSRTNILNQGAILSDILADGRLERDTYELKIDGLAKIDRAHILYNHIWHSQLAPSFVEELYKGRRYKQVIAHRNYNPRLIAFIVDSEKVGSPAVDQYWKHVTQTFANPKDVWRHFFEAQLDQDGRDLAYLVVLNGDRIEEAALRKSFLALRQRDRINQADADHRFHIALRHVTGSVINRSVSSDGTNAIYTLFNPSVADYVQARLGTSTLWVHYYTALRTPGALRRLREMNSRVFGRTTYLSILRSLLETELGQMFVADGYSLQLIVDTLEHDELKPLGKEVLSTWLHAQHESMASIDETTILRILPLAATLLSPDDFIPFAEDAAIALDDGFVPQDEPKLTAAALRSLRKAGAHRAYDRVRKCIIDEWDNNLATIIKEADVLAGFYDDEDVWNATRKVEEYILDMMQSLGIELSSDEINKLSEQIDVAAEIDNNRQLALRDEEAEMWRRRIAPSAAHSEREDLMIDDLFDRS